MASSSSHGDGRTPAARATTGAMTTAAERMHHHLPMGVRLPEAAGTPLKGSLQGVPVCIQKTPSTSTFAQQLSCLPQSACSPMLHTPGGASVSVSRITPASSSSCKYRTPGSGRENRFTPRFHTTPGGTSKQIVSNPFEPHLMDKLHSDSPMFSPNMFKLVEPGSAEKTPKSFRWSIDQIAILKPAEIDEMPIQQDTLNLVDKVSDVKAQKAIEKFFEKGNIVPSPWTEPVKFELPRTPVTVAAECHRATPVAMETSTKETACQTLITLPKDFDLEKVLGDQHAYSGLQSVTMDSADNNADMSTSSLRRKLFFHGDQGLSPVRGNKSRVTEVMDMTSPLVSPVKFVSTPLCQGKLSPVQTPSSGQFSSSPIHGRDSLTTPSIRRCSTAPGSMESPDFSPIGGPDHKAADVLQTPLHTRLQATPSSGALSREFGTPGISPITMAAGGHGNSYVESPDTKSYSKSDSLRRRALRGHSDRPPVPRELQMSPIANPFSLGLINNPPTPLTHGNTDDAQLQPPIMDMSYEHLDDIALPVKTTDLHRPEFTEFREYDDFDGDNTTGFHVNSHSNNTQSQDTGYQTYSANQETGFITQNLSMNQEDLDSVSGLEAAPTNITGHFSALSSNLGFNEAAQCKARTVLKAKFPSRVHFDIEEEKEMDEVNNKTLPFSLYKDSSAISLKSTDDLIAEKPSSSIFSDLEHLANKFGGTTQSNSSSFNFDQNTGTSSTQGKIAPPAPKSICKSFSTGNMGSLRAPDASECHVRGKSECVDDVQWNSEHKVSAHMREYTQGSMIQHQQVYEPPIYVITQEQPESKSFQCINGARSCEGVYEMNNTEFESRTINKEDGLFHLTRTQSLSRVSHSDNVNSDISHPRNNPVHRSQSVPSASLSPAPPEPQQPQIQLGRPAHTNPAFTIETLTPKSSQQQPRFSGLCPLSNESQSLGVAPLHPRGLKLAQRLLFPEQHPPSPAMMTRADGLTQGKSTGVSEARMDVGNTTGKASHVTLYEGDASRPPWYYTAASCTPKRQSVQKLVRSMERRKQDTVDTMLPSEVAMQVLRKAERDLAKLKHGEPLDPSFLDNSSFQDSCIVEDIAFGAGTEMS